MKVVAEKTGYPAEMLSSGMDLEADLGIDSIKRVEILSAMREEAPELPEVDAGEMAALRTLGQIVEYMGQAGGGAAAPKAAPVSGPTAAEAGVSRYVLDAEEAEAAGLTLPGLGQGVWLLPDDQGVAEALAAVLSNAGIQVRVGGAPGSEKALVALNGLSELDGVAADQAALEVFRAARAVAGDCAAFVTVQDTGGDFGLRGAGNPWLGGFAGLAKTAALEWPAAGVKAIDLEKGGRSAQELAQAIAGELLAGGPEREVGLQADGTRVRLVSREAEVEGGSESVDADSVLLVSGGARGVTAATVIALGQATKASFVLLGRTQLGDEPAAVAGLSSDAEMKRALLVAAKNSGQAITPAELGKTVKKVMAWREIRATLNALEAAGSKARYVSVSVTDAPALEALVQQVESQWGPVTGVIHGAGVLADKAIVDKTDDQFQLVYNTKIQGLRALMEATRQSPIRTWVQFSSVAARAGNTGQCDYAMANEVLNKTAGQMAAQHPDWTVKSLNWGPWEGGMVTPALKARFQSLGVPLIPLDVGARMLVDELQGSARSRVELVLGGEPKPEALLSEGNDEGADTFEVRVGAGSHAWLQDHSIKETPVVPVVLVLEWFARAAKAARPDLRLVACEDLRVLKGISLERFKEEGHGFRIQVRQLSNGQGVVLGMELLGAEDRRHYSARAVMAQRTDALSAADTLSSLEDWKGEVYGDVLFHGPELQVITDLEGVSDEGLAARLSGTAERSWQPEPWKTDVAAMDGGLQMALLWAKRMLGGASLPTAVGRYEGTGELPSGPISAVLRGKVVGSSKTVSEIVFTSEQGEPIARLSGVETHLLPKRS